MPERINCPQCGRTVEYISVSDVPTFPFCSDRCRWGDLDKWLEGDYVVSEELTEASEGEDGRQDRHFPQLP